MQKIEFSEFPIRKPKAKAKMLLKYVNQQPYRDHGMTNE